MSNKLDPALDRLVEESRRGGVDEASTRAVPVMVALDHGLTPEDEARLRGCGLELRSVIGDIITGSIAIGSLLALAADPSVVAVEGGRPLEAEVPED
jgi:hypothetical protein